jgi:iron(III) transport system substrate-binding protein
MRAIVAAVFGMFALTSVEAAAKDTINIYSHRQPFLIQPFIDAYQAKNDVTINVIFAKRGLAQRLQAEGRNSPADLVLTVDIARIPSICRWRAFATGALRHFGCQYSGQPACR